jgi:DNA-binding LacI/PurR family transcriptional regulator
MTKSTGRRRAANDGNQERDTVTIYDVAERAGVSITTVSNVLNKPARVGAASSERVLRAMDELGFTPKAAAVSRARKGVGRIGVLAPFSSYASYRERLVGVLRACDGRPVEVVVYDQQSVAEATSPLLSSLPTTGRLDGLLIVGLPLKDAMAERLANRNLPAVLVDSFHRDLTSVNTDDEAGGYLAATHLLDRGYRTFAYVRERQRSGAFLSQGQKRTAGFVKALVDSGLQESALRHVITTNDVAGGQRAATEIMATGSRPDAVFAHFDDIAAGLLSGFRSAGLRVPDDVAVMGYDDGPLAQAIDITTVRQPFIESGRLGCVLLLDQLYGTSRSIQHVTLPVDLVVRNTA